MKTQKEKRESKFEVLTKEQMKSIAGGEDKYIVVIINGVEYRIKI